jgi:antitoxin HigA-1
MGEPPHPGSLLKEEVILALGTTATQAATDLGVNRMPLHCVLSERRAVSPEMAIRLGAWSGKLLTR